MPKRSMDPWYCSEPCGALESALELLAGAEHETDAAGDLAGQEADLDVRGAGGQGRDPRRGEQAGGRN